MSSREVRRHNQIVLESLEPGDLVQFPCGVYGHWAVYTGDNDIVHLSGVDGPMESNIKHLGTLSGQEFNKGIVRKDGFWEVVGDSKVYKDNSKDIIMSHFNGSEIVQRANARVGEVDVLLRGLAAGVAVVGFGVELVAWFRGGKEKDKEKEAMY